MQSTGIFQQILEAIAQALQHGGRKVHRDGFRIGMRELHEPQQASVAAAEVEKSADARRQSIQQSRFPFGAMRDRVGAAEIIQRVFG